MFQLPRSLRLLAVSLLACVIPIGAARAEHFKFIVVFLDGSLSGSVHAGYFTTNKPTGDFTPDAHIGGQLMSLIISIDGAWFMMQDDKDFPWLPRVKVQSPSLTPIFDFDASKGSVTALHDKWVWMLRSTYDKANLVHFGSWRRGEQVLESTGLIYDIYQIEPSEAPPDPQCSECHSRLKR